MSYATQQDLIDRFGEVELIELTDREEPLTEAIVTSVIDRALADADAEIDSFIGKRYTLPLASTPPRLVKVASDIARYNLYTDTPNDQVANNYKAAVAWLRDLAKGNSELDIDGEEPAADTSASPTFSAPDRVFTRDTLKGL
jgi:phage gp36-like protein